jgi:DNA-binding response OmpR family regulator
MASRGKLLVVDDDKTLLQLLDLSLKDEGYDVTCATNGRDALRTVFTERPDLIVLDIMMPGMSGWQVCERVREVSDVPVLILTARGDPEDRVRGLELGADDYLSKPFDIHELTLRVGAILRRTWSGNASTSRTSQRYDDGHLFVDLETRVVQYDGQVIKLTPYEFDLLSCFVRHPGKVLEHDYLLRQVWGLNSGTGDNDYVKTYIRYLRKKIEPDPQQPRYITTERGVGYRFMIRPKSQTSQGE